MAAHQLDRHLLGLATLVAGIGAVDAAISRDADLLVLFVGLAALVATVLVRSHLGRRAVPLRKDVVAWLDERAVATGERVEVLADRSISSYRAGLEP